MNKVSLFISIAALTIIAGTAVALTIDLKLPYALGEEWTITRGYGPNSTHKRSDLYALDFGLLYGHSVLAAADGIVVYARDTRVDPDKKENQAYGNFVIINIGENLMVRYGHLSKILIAEGDKVRQGQIIGKVGNTGNVEPKPTPDNSEAGKHLHFAIYQVDEKGKKIAIKPEPMSGYGGGQPKGSFVAGNWYTSDNELFEPNKVLTELPAAAQPTSRPSLVIRVISWLDNQFQRVIGIFTGQPSKPKSPANVLDNGKGGAEAESPLVIKPLSAAPAAKKVIPPPKAAIKPAVSSGQVLGVKIQAPNGEASASSLPPASTVAPVTAPAAAPVILGGGGGGGGGGSSQSVQDSNSNSNSSSTSSTPYTGPGTLNFSKDPASPTSSVSPGASNTVFAKYLIQANGEDMQLRKIVLAVVNTGQGKIPLSDTISVKVDGNTVLTVPAWAVSANAPTEQDFNSLFTLSVYPLLKAGVSSSIAVEASVDPQATAADSYQVYLGPVEIKRVTTNDIISGMYFVDVIAGNNILVTGEGGSTTTSSTPTGDTTASSTPSSTLAKCVSPSTLLASSTGPLVTNIITGNFATASYLAPSGTASLVPHNSSYSNLSPHFYFTRATRVSDSNFIQLAWSFSGSDWLTTDDLFAAVYSLAYSADNGQTWQALANSVAAREGTYQVVASSSLLIRGRVEFPTYNNKTSQWTTTTLKFFPPATGRGIVINELAPLGTSAARPDDQWIELFNTTGQPVSLAGWTLVNASGTLSIVLSGVINPYSYFLLTQGDSLVFSNLKPDQVYHGLMSTGGEDLLLKNTTGEIVDEANFNAGWPIASQNCAEPFTLMRIDALKSGSQFNNWATGYVGFRPYAKNRDEQFIHGSPAGANHQRLQLDGEIDRALTLTAQGGPYEVGRVVIAANGSLTLEPGAVLRMQPRGLSDIYNIGEIVVHNGGQLFVQGTVERPVVFTSFYDNYYGGELAEAPTGTPGSFDWRQIVFAPTAGESTIERAVVRFGGEFCGAPYCTYNDAEEILSQSSAVSVLDSDIQAIDIPAITVIDAVSTVSGNQLAVVLSKPADTRTRPAALSIRGGAARIDSNKVEGRIDVLDSAAPVLSNNIIAGSLGAAIKIYNSTPILQDNIYSGNQFDGPSLGGVIASDYTLAPLLWRLDSPTVGPEATLFVPKGTRLEAKSGLMVLGRLLANGTSEEPIIFNTQDSIKFSDSAKDSEISNAIVNYTYYFGQRQAIDVKDGAGSLTLDNVNISVGGAFFNGIICFGCSRLDEFRELQVDGRWLFTDVRVANSTIKIMNSVLSQADFGAELSGNSRAMIINSIFSDDIIGISTTSSVSLTSSNNTFKDVDIPIDPPDWESRQNANAATSSAATADDATSTPAGSN